MTDPSPPPAPPPVPSSPPSPPSPLGRAWIGPGLVAAGLLALGRAEVLELLAVNRRGIDPEMARWAARDGFGVLLIQALVMGMAASAVVWSARGKRRYGGWVFASLICLSALTGWPIERAGVVPTGNDSGLANLGVLIGLAFGGSLLLAAAAWLAEKNHRTRRLLSSIPAVALVGLAGLGIPTWLLYRDANRPPMMPVREVVRDLVTEQGSWEVVSEVEGRPAVVEVICPFVDQLETGCDTGDKPTLVMPPPCEVRFRVSEQDGPVNLVAAAQIDHALSQRWLDGQGTEHPSQLDGLEIPTISVRFELLVDGEPVFDSVIAHQAEQPGKGREWVHVGGGEPVELRPGQTVTLRTSLGDQATSELYATHPFKCGFGGLLLERWNERPRTTATRQNPNVLFVVMDTLRADRMSCYGYPKETTPNLDRLAERGVRFENAFASSSWTWPSTASLLTGLKPYEHGVLSNASCHLNYSYETLAEALQERGYTTAAISGNPLIDPDHHFDQGFETFDAAPRMRMTDEVIDSIESTLDRLADKRFFLYLHLVDPHTPHRPLASELERLGGQAPLDYPDEEVLGKTIDGLDHYAKRLLAGEGRDPDGTPHPERVIPAAHRNWLNDRYDASVGTGDHFVGRVLDRLESLGLTERTIVVFTSDHGEELLDHGMLEHGHALWRELVRVPLVIAGPDLPEGKTVDEPVSNRHLAPTLAMIGNAELGPDDSLNLLGDDLEPTGRHVFYQTSKGYWNGHRKQGAGADLKDLELYGCRIEEFSLQYAPHGGDWGKEPAPNGQARLFNNTDDPRERVNLAGDWRETSPRGLWPLPLPAVAFAGHGVWDLKRDVEDQRLRRQGLSLALGAAGAHALPPGYTGDAEQEDPVPQESQAPGEQENNR